MKNAEVILKERIRLMKEGKIKATNKKITVTDNSGHKQTINAPEEIGTVEYWNNNKYRVKKGSHAVTNLRIWKFKEATVIENADTGEKEEIAPKLIQVNANFFSASQVIPIKSKK